METASMILSRLIQSDEVMYLFWGVLGALNLFFGSFLLKGEHLNEEELTKKSPDFKHINSDYMIFSVIAIAILFLLLGMTWSRFDNWAWVNYGRKFYPSVVFLFSAYGIYQALFALSKGVYPMGRMLSFIFDDGEVIRRAAKRQIISSIGLSLLSVLFFFITSSRIQ
jgi:hypothetical protein